MKSSNRFIMGTPLALALGSHASDISDRVGAEAKQCCVATGTRFTCDWRNHRVGVDEPCSAQDLADAIQGKEISILEIMHYDLKDQAAANLVLDGGLGAVSPGLEQIWLNGCDFGSEQMLVSTPPQGDITLYITHSVFHGLEINGMDVFGSLYLKSQSLNLKTIWLNYNQRFPPPDQRFFPDSWNPETAIKLAGFPALEKVDARRQYDQGKQYDGVFLDSQFDFSRLKRDCTLENECLMLSPCGQRSISDTVQNIFECDQLDRQWSTTSDVIKFTEDILQNYDRNFDLTDPFGYEFSIDIMYHDLSGNNAQLLMDALGQLGSWYPDDQDVPLNILTIRYGKFTHNQVILPDNFYRITIDSTNTGYLPESPTSLNLKCPSARLKDLLVQYNDPLKEISLTGFPGLSKFSAFANGFDLSTETYTTAIDLTELDSFDFSELQNATPRTGSYSSILPCTCQASCEEFCFAVQGLEPVYPGNPDYENSPWVVCVNECDGTCDPDNPPKTCGDPDLSDSLGCIAKKLEDGQECTPEQDVCKICHK